MADFKQLIDQAVQKYGLSPEWAGIGYRQMMAESGGNPNAVSPKGAQGLMQFMPKTAKGYGLQNPNDPAQSVDAWARMTKDLIKQTGGNPAHVLAAYNWGIGNLNKQGMDKMPAETRGYLQKILGGLPAGGTKLAQAVGAAPIPAAVYRPRGGPAAHSIGPADYHAALDEHSKPGVPPQDPSLATPKFDMAMYSPKTSQAYTPDNPLDAWQPEEVG